MLAVALLSQLLFECPRCVGRAPDHCDIAVTIPVFSAACTDTSNVTAGLLGAAC